MNSSFSKIFLLFAFFTISADCNAAAPPAQFPIAEWRLELDQPIEQMETSASAAMSQSDMNYTSANLGFIYDTKLYVLFHQYLAKLSVPERFNQIEEQRKWLVRRIQKSVAAGKQAEGGTMEPQLRSIEFAYLTEKRIQEIQSRMSRK